LDLRKVAVALAGLWGSAGCVSGRTTVYGPLPSQILERSR